MKKKTVQQVLAEHDGHNLSSYKDASGHESINCDDCEAVLAVKKDDPSFFQVMMTATE